MLYTLLVGQPPFESEAVKNTLEKVSRADYELPPWISHEAHDLIVRMLQRVRQFVARRVDFACA
jgi:polo-like kinase 4